MASFNLPDWDEASGPLREDITPSPVLFDRQPPNGSSRDDRADTRAFQSITINSPRKVQAQSEYNTISAERDVIMQKDLLLLECSRVFGSFNGALSSLDNVLISINEAFEKQGGVDNKDLAKLLLPLTALIRDFNVVSDICPREAVVLQSRIQKLFLDTKEAFTLISQCISDNGRLYKEQLHKMREISNASTRNALTAERGEHTRMLLKLRNQCDEELSSLREKLHQREEDSEGRIASLLEKIEKLRRANKELESVQDESSADKIRGRIERAVQHAVNEEKMEHQKRSEEMESSWGRRMAELDEVWQRKVGDLEEIHKERQDLQAQHHEKMSAILLDEKSKVETECERLKLAMQRHTDELASEKEKMQAERIEEMRQKELETDLRNAEHVKAVSAIKAELTAKVRLLKEEERRRLEDTEVAFNKDKEQIESAHAAEMDRLIGQHRRALQQLRAQLEVKFEEELTSVKRRQENEIKRYTAEIDRLRRLVARRGTGAGQDGISLVTYDSDDGQHNEYQYGRSSTAIRSGKPAASTSSSPFNASRSSSLFSRKKSPEHQHQQTERYSHPDFKRTIRTQNDFNKTVRFPHDTIRESPVEPTRFVQFHAGERDREPQSTPRRSVVHEEPDFDLEDSLTFSPATGDMRNSSNRAVGEEKRAKSLSTSRESNASSVSSEQVRLKWGALEDSLAQQDQLLGASSPVRRRADMSPSPSPTRQPDSFHSPAINKSPSAISSDRPQSTSRSNLSTGYSPTNTRPKYTGRIYTSSPTRSEDRDDDIPPPPPDPFNIDAALEESKVPGHNVRSNATNVGKYMLQLERYLQGQEAPSDSVFSSTGDTDEENLHDEIISFPTEYLDVVGETSWREIEDSYDMSADIDNDSLSGE